MMFAKWITLWIARLNGFAGVVLFAALTVVVSLQVFTRFVLHAPMIWSEEVARFLFFWTVLLGAARSVYDRRHFVIETNSFHERDGIVARVLRLVPHIVVIGFSAFLVVVGWEYTQMGRFRIATNSQVNMIYVYAAIPTFAVLSTLYSLHHIAAEFADPQGAPKRPDPPPTAE